MANFIIRGTYKGKPEQVDEADTREGAEEMLVQYQQAFGKDWILEIIDLADICHNPAWR